MEPSILAKSLVCFYMFWHGKLHLKGSGLLLSQLAPFVESLHDYPLFLSRTHHLRVDFRDISGACWLNYLAGDKFEETGLLKAIKRFVHADSHVWDVGSNCGIVSYILAKETNVKRITFFEPNKDMFALSALALKPFGIASGLNVALSDTPGDAVLTIPERNSTTASLAAASVGESSRSLSVLCETGDELVADGRALPPNVVKIDTEGHEAAVIRGMQATVRAYRPCIFFEHLALSDREVQGLIPDEYDIFSVGFHDGVLKEGFDRTRGHNSALIPKRQ